MNTQDTAEKKNKKLEIGWFGTAFALIGQLLMIFQNPIAFIAWSLGEGTFLYLAYKRKDKSEVIFLAIYVITNIIALINWVFEIV